MVCRRIWGQVLERLEAESWQLGIGLHVVSWIFWSPPPGSALKPNFDAAICEDGRAKGGCDVRDGKILLAAAFHCEYLVIDVAELRAAWETIRLLKFHFS